MLRRRHQHPKVRALLPLLLGSGSSSPKPLGSCGSPPLPHFLKHLLGSPAALSRVAGGGAGDPCSLTLHFLRNSCCLPEPAAAAAAARVRLRSTKKAHDVLALFRGIGLAGADLWSFAILYIRTLYSFTNETLAKYSYTTSHQATLRYGILISLVQDLGLGFTYGLTICSCDLQLWVGRFLISHGRANGGEVVVALFAIILNGFGLNRVTTNFYSDAWEVYHHS